MPSRPGPVCVASTGPISLRHGGLAAEYLPAALHQAGVGVRGVDVLGAPAVGARVVALARVVHHPLEGA